MLGLDGWEAGSLILVLVMLNCPEGTGEFRAGLPGGGGVQPGNIYRLGGASNPPVRARRCRGAFPVCGVGVPVGLNLSEAECKRRH